MNLSDFCITEEKIEGLRARVKALLSPKRWLHTSEVEKMAARLAELYCPQKANLLRAAALLHDITKEWPVAGLCV